MAIYLCNKCGHPNQGKWSTCAKCGWKPVVSVVSQRF